MSTSETTSNQNKIVDTYFCDDCFSKKSALLDKVSDWWQVELQGTLKEKEIDTIGNQKALKILESTCNKTPSGHYETCLLWINDQCLPNNRRLAELHLQGLQRKLAKDVGLLDRYDAEIQKDLKAFISVKLAHLKT